MGIPRFGELVRRRYPGCWFNQGEADVFQGSRMNLGGKVVEVDTLYVDGNGLLHPAMQFTFAYGSFEDERRRVENEGKTEEELIREGTNFFLNAIKALCVEFRPKRLVLAIDGSAPIAKMIQQRQRRFGAKMDLSKDGSLTEAWKVTLTRNLKIAVQKEESFVNIKILHNTSIKDGGQFLLETRLSELVEGSSAKKIFDVVSANLIEYSASLRLRWYNLLDPETPLGFEFGGRGWYSLASAASALAFQDQYGSGTWVDLLSLKSPEALVVRLDTNNRFIYTNGKILNGEEQKQLKKNQDDYKNFKERNKEFFLTKSPAIARRLKEIIPHIVKSHPIYAEILLRTGVGTNLITNDGQTMTWLMEIRTSILQEKEREYYSKEAAGAAPAVEEIDYPDYEGGFRGVEGVATVGKFDSNSLTPGTSVMEIIDKTLHLRFKGGKFRISEDEQIDVEFSGHRVPGEGEHKIMNLIDNEKRDMRGKTSLVYGLDADLFMLSMVRNHPLCLIRENVFHRSKFFGRDDRKIRTRSSCHVVDIELFKQLLSTNGIHPQDFTLLCFLFGNDFLRNVPGFVFDRKMQVVMDPKFTRDDEGENPVLFDYLFTNTVARKTHYTEMREEMVSRRILKDQDPMLVRTRGSPMKVQWLSVYELLTRISGDENKILDGMVRRMDSEIQLEKQMKEEKPDYVPVSLRYRLLLESRSPKQIVVGGPLEQKGVLTTDFRYEEFKAKWTSHITSNIPGYRTDGTAEGLTRDKKDVLRQICQTYLEGMEWAIKYYTNNHYLPIKGEKTEKRSILNNRWYYPYSHAPLVSQLRDHLLEFLLEDARRMFVVEVERLRLHSREEVLPHVSNLVRVLFSGMAVMRSGSKDRFMKLERDILDLVPGEIFGRRGERVTIPQERLLSELLWNHYRSLRGRELKFIPSEPQYVRSLEGLEKGYPYGFENTFSSGWAKPRFLYGPRNEALVAPSTTNYRVQLLAVLPQQSTRFFPDGALVSDPEISWMYPETVSVDFTFRDRVHAAILQLPPPNLQILESYLSEVRVRNIEKQIDEDVFPDTESNWAVSETVLRKKTSYRVMSDYVRYLTEDFLHGDVRGGVCVDVFGGVGISTMAALDVFDRVVVFEPDRQNFRDLQQNLKLYQKTNQTVETRNEYFDLSKVPEAVSMYIFDYPVGEQRRKTDSSAVTLKTDSLPGSGIPIEGVIESLVERFISDDKLHRLLLFFKLPFHKKIGKIHTTLDMDIAYKTETADAINYKVCRLVISKKTDGEGYGGGYGEGYGGGYGEGYGEGVYSPY